MVLDYYVDSLGGSQSIRPDVVPLLLTSPYLDPMGFAPGLVAAEFESRGRPCSRRGWRRNGANCQGAGTSESPAVDLQASA